MVIVQPVTRTSVKLQGLLTIIKVLTLTVQGGGAVHRPSTFSIITFLVIMVEAKKKRRVNLSFDNAETIV